MNDRTGFKPFVGTWAPAGEKLGLLRLWWSQGLHPFVELQGTV